MHPVILLFGSMAHRGSLVYSSEADDFVFAFPA